MNPRFLPALVPILFVAGAGAARAAVPSYPVDCLPDRVGSWRAAEPDPGARYGAANLPGIVLGPPGDSSPTTGSTSVASLGPGGETVLAWDDIVIEDRPGPDFIVFENAFFVGSPPEDPGDDYTIFDEPGFVEVSPDGVHWTRFPYDEAALAEAHGRNIDRDLHLRLRGLAGITPTFSGNWTVPDDPDEWDPEGTHGISGAGGDAFDLATVGLAEVRFVRIIDARAENGVPGNAEGFDLDAVIVLHGRPAAAFPPALDSDGDGLPDAAEREIYGSDPLERDTDGDGTDDGREVAGCRDPSSPATGPWRVRGPRVFVLRRDGATVIDWSFPGSGIAADVFRGDVSGLLDGGTSIDPGPGECLGDGVVGVRLEDPGADPAPGQAWQYLVRLDGNPSWGWSSGPKPRETDACP